AGLVLLAALGLRGAQRRAHAQLLVRALRLLVGGARVSAVIIGTLRSPQRTSSPTSLTPLRTSRGTGPAFEKEPMVSLKPRSGALNLPWRIGPGRARAQTTLTPRTLDALRMSVSAAAASGAGVKAAGARFSLSRAWAGGTQIDTSAFSRLLPLEPERLRA